jgi:hypothetical protein
LLFVQYVIGSLAEDTGLRRRRIYETKITDEQTTRLLLSRKSLQMQLEAIKCTQALLKTSVLVIFFKLNGRFKRPIGENGVKSVCW